MKKEQVTITSEVCFHHLPYNPGIEIKGLSLRQALKKLRKITWGNLGGTFSVQLSDNSTLSVENQPVNGGGWLMSSQIAIRECWDTYSRNNIILRKYNL